MQPHIMTQAYLITVHSNSWDCPILSLSQLLSDTLSDLISDTRSALLRDSLWWEADKEEGSNSDQNHCCHLGSCLLCSHTICYSLLEYFFVYCNQSSQLTDGQTAAPFIGEPERARAEQIIIICRYSNTQAQ